MAIGAKDNSKFCRCLRALENTKIYIVMNKIPPLESIKPNASKPNNVILSALSSRLA